MRNFPNLRRHLRRSGLYALRKGVNPPRSSFARRMYELAAVRDLIRRYGINIVLDVGANEGMFAQAIRSMGYTGDIFCFEPIGSNCDTIRKMAEGDPKWHVVECALGSDDSEMEFTVNTVGNGSTTMSSLLGPLKESFLKGAKVKLEEKVIRVARLDTISGELFKSARERRIFLKMDTQGYDLRVLEGAKGVLPEIHAIQSEVSVVPIYASMPHYLESLTIYENAGFGLIDLFVVNRDPDGFVIEYDALMARSGSA